MSVEYSKQDPMMQGNPPPYSPPPVVQAPGPTMVIGSPMVPVVVMQQMGPQPSAMTCRTCNVQIVTRVERKASLQTHLWAACLCIFGCWPCVWIPYCTESCTDADHYCPNCNVYIGTYRN